MLSLITINRLIFVLYGGFVVLLLIHNSSEFEPIRHTGLIVPPSLISNEPVGEIVNNYIVEQNITINNKHMEDLINFNPTDKVCVAFLYANYANRKNHGFLKISLYSKNINSSELLDVKAIRDNRYVWTCFDEVLVKDLKQDNYTLRVEGVNAVLGESVTIWLTSDVRHGKAVINGVESEKSLQFKMSIAVVDISFSISLWLFVIINILCVFILYRVFSINMC